MPHRQTAVIFYRTSAVEYLLAGPITRPTLRMSREAQTATNSGVTPLPVTRDAGYNPREPRSQSFSGKTVVGVPWIVGPANKAD